MQATVVFAARIWVYSGKAAWHFVTLPKLLSRRISEETAGMRAGWGSVRVQVAIGDCRWETSIFPDGKRDAFLLPLKAAVRKRVGVYEGDRVKVSLTYQRRMS